MSYQIFFWGCTAVWILLAIYLFAISRRARRLERKARGRREVSG